jgi:transcriptional regulator with GAF, ATPase, and Fis domain
MPDIGFPLSLHAPPGNRVAMAIADELGGDLRGLQDPPRSGTRLVVLFLDGTETHLQEPLLRGLLSHRRHDPPQVVCVRSRGDSALSLLRAGASDVLGGDEQQQLAELRETCAHWRRVAHAVDVARTEMLGSSAVWREAVRNLVEAALFCRHPVLITGENGTGKELAARLLHRLDPSPDKRELVVLDCATISPELSGSEFFGHERGAFTSAFETRDGVFAQADGGTLFLDEVGELPVRLQAELLRATQEKSFRRVGGSRWFKVDFRLVAATNRDLSRERNSGGFREDFFHRIAAWRCHLPPLRERRDDILPMARHFFALERPGSDPDLSNEVADFLLHRDYPGNTRELVQLVRRMAVRWKGHGPIQVGCIPAEERAGIRVFASGFPVQHEPPPPTHAAAFLEKAIERMIDDGIGLGDIKEHASEVAYRIALEKEEGNIQRAARSLQVSDRSVQLFVKSSKQGGGDP